MIKIITIIGGEGSLIFIPQVKSCDGIIERVISKLKDLSRLADK